MDLFVSNAVSLAGLIVIMYKSAKTLKARFDVELDEEVEREEHSFPGSKSDSLSSSFSSSSSLSSSLSSSSAPSSMHNYSPESLTVAELNNTEERQTATRRKRIPQTVSELLFVSPGRKSLLGHRRRFSTLQERTTSLTAAGQLTTSLLHFWVLFAITHLLADYNVPYAIEIRAIVVILGMLPVETGASFLAKGFQTVAVPLLGTYGNRIASLLQGYAIAGVNAVSPILRGLFAYITLAALPYAGTSQVLAYEAIVKESSLDAGLEIRQRKQAKRESSAGITMMGIGNGGGMIAGASIAGGGGGGGGEYDVQFARHSDASEMMTNNNDNTTTNVARNLLQTGLGDGGVGAGGGGGGGVRVEEEDDDVEGNSIPLGGGGVAVNARGRRRNNNFSL